MTDRKALQLRLPLDLKDWIAQQAAKNMSSQNSEVVRAIRERKYRVGGSVMLSSESLWINFKQGSPVTGDIFSWNAEGKDDESAK